MLGLAFKLMSQYLSKLEDSPEDWHMPPPPPIRGHTRVDRLFPFYLADFATLEILGIITVSQIFETYLRVGIDKTFSPDILALLTQYLALQYKLTIVMSAFRHMPFWNSMQIHIPTSWNS